MEQNVMADNQKKWQEAIEVLRKYGVVRYASNLDMYHGRSRSIYEVGEWSVNPDFNNSGNNTQNHNVNQMPALNVGNLDVATKFANARAKQNGGSPEVHKIEATDENSIIIDVRYDDKGYNEAQKREIIQAFDRMSRYGITELAPIKFQDKSLYARAYDSIIRNITRENVRFISDQMVEDVVSELSSDSEVISLIEQSKSENIYARENSTPRERLVELITTMSGSMNARTGLIFQTAYTIRKYKNNDNVLLFNCNSENPAENRGPLNMEYVSQWLSHNHVIGYRDRISSATINQDINAFFLFDLHKINTQKEVGIRNRQLLERYSDLSKIVAEFENNSETMEVLKNSDCKETVAFITDKCKHGEMGRKAGVWEDFTVGEHTESVLRIFDESFAHEVPEALLPLAKLALVTHDIGKGVAHDKSKQISNADPNKPILTSSDYWTKKVCEYLFEDLGIDPKMREIVMFITTKSQAYTTDYFVRQNKASKEKLRQACGSVLSQTISRDVSRSEIEGLVNLCEILQTCDSASYTPYASTRREVSLEGGDSIDQNMFFANANERFAEVLNSNGTTSGDVRLREPEM